MVEKLIERKKREAEAISQASKGHKPQPTVSDKELFRQMGRMVKVVKPS